MTDMTTENAAAPKQDWAEAIAEANEPPPQLYKENLPCKLTNEELLAMGKQHRALLKKRTLYEEHTKMLVAERKAGLAKLLEEEKRLVDSLDSEQVEREVEIVEYVSFRQNRRWKVRRDTGETFFEKSLEPGERQPPLPGVSDKQLPLGAQAKADEPDEGFDRFADADETEIDDPQALLDEASDDSEDE